jgi:transposase-like protein
VQNSKPSEQAVIDRYLAGASLRSIARDVGMSPSWVRATLVRAGIPRRPAKPPRGSSRGRYTKRRRSRVIVAYYLAGFTLRQTAARYGLTWQGVAAILDSAGINRRHSYTRLDCSPN